MSSTIDQLDLFEFDENDQAVEERREKRRRYDKPDYRRKKQGVPVKNGTPFCIVPEVAPILGKLAEQAAREASYEMDEKEASGIGILGARAAVVLGMKEAAVVRRLYSVIHQKQLFVNAPFVEGCLMAMDAEHEFQYGEWPSCRADALERVALEAEFSGKKVSPTKLLARANRLYEKGLRKAFKRAVEVDV